MLKKQYAIVKKNKENFNVIVKGMNDNYLRIKLVFMNSISQIQVQYGTEAG